MWPWIAISGISINPRKSWLESWDEKQNILARWRRFKVPHIFGAAKPARCKGSTRNFPVQLPPNAAERCNNEIIVKEAAFAEALYLPTRAWGLLEPFVFCGACPVYQYNLRGWSFCLDYILGLYVDEKQLKVLIEEQMKTFRVRSNKNEFTDNDLEDITDTVLQFALTPEVQKCLVFRYNDRSPVNFTYRLERAMEGAIKTIVSHEFDFEAYERMISSLFTVLRYVPVEKGTTIAITTISTPPPLCAVFAAPNAEEQLQFIGGISGKTMSAVLHCLFIEDPYTLDQSCYYSDASLRLRRSLRATVAEQRGLHMEQLDVSMPGPMTGTEIGEEALTSSASVKKMKLNVEDSERNEDVGDEARVEQLTELLLDLRATPFTTYEKMLPTLIHHDAFRRVPQQDRKNFFTQALKRLRVVECRRQFKQDQNRLQQLKDFLADMERKNRLKSSSDPIQMFNMFTKTVSGTVDDDTRTKSLAVIGEAINACKERRMKRQKLDEAEFKSLIRDKVLPLLEETTDGILSWQTVKWRIRHDERYVAVGPEDRERLFMEVIRSRLKHLSNRDGDNRRRKGPAPRGGAHLHRGGEHPQNSLPSSPFHQFHNAQSLLQQLLTERIKNPFVTQFEDAIAQLETDSRFRPVAERLPQQVLVENYRRFTMAIRADRLRSLRSSFDRSEFLRDNPSAEFDQVKAELKWEDDPRFAGLQDSYTEPVYNDFRQKKIRDAVAEAQVYLKATPLVTADSPESGPAFDELLEKLSEDIRFERLAGVPEIQRNLVKERIQRWRDRRVISTEERKKAVAAGDESINVL